MVQVAIQRCKDYDLEEVRSSIKESIKQIGGIRRFIKKGDRVLLKPNLLAPSSPKDCVTTHPVFVEAVIDIVKEAGGKPFLGDSPGLSAGGYIYQKTGMKELCERRKVKIVNFEEKRDFTFQIRNRKRTFPFYKDLFKYDLIINLPKFKTHSLTIFTGAVKNLFGAVSGLRKARYHMLYPTPEQFTNLTLDIYESIKPRLTLMDGVFGMDGNGPRMGTVKNFGLILASDDSLAIDTVACRVAGMKDADVPLINLAKRRKLAGAMIKNIQVYGGKIEDFRIKGFQKPKAAVSMIPGFIYKPLRSYISARPVVIFDKCKSCQNCAKICPVSAIKMKEVSNKRIPIFDYSLCIRCYCCQEMCPHRSINLERTGLFKYLFKRQTE